MKQKVKFFSVNYGIDPFGSLEEKINKWIEKKNVDPDSSLSLVIDAISHNVNTSSAGRTTYSAFVLYHYK